MYHVHIKNAPMCHAGMPASGHWHFRGHYLAKNVSGLMLVSPSAPVGRVRKARSLVGLYGKLTCHTTPPKWGPIYRKARVQFLETAMTKSSHPPPYEHERTSFVRPALLTSPPMMPCPALRGKVPRFASQNTRVAPGPIVDDMGQGCGR